MADIFPIQPEQVQEARRVIYSVAHGLFHPDRPIDEVTADWDARGTLADLEDIERNYFANGGTFLVVIEGGRVIGTGALRQMDGDVAELKRLWLLPEYHGMGLGYAVAMELFRVAREKQFRFIRLETDATRQTRAIAFYRQLGFHEIPRYGADPDAIAFEIELGSDPR
jgi:putative acetyltransferase